MEEQFTVYDHSKMARKSWFVDQQVASKASDQLATTSTATTAVTSTGATIPVVEKGSSQKIPIDQQPLAELKTIQTGVATGGLASETPSIIEGGRSTPLPTSSAPARPAPAPSIGDSPPREGARTPQERPGIAS